MKPRLCRQCTTATTNGQPPTLTILSMYWYQMPQVHTRQLLNMCCQNSIRGILSIRRSLMLSAFLTLKFRSAHSGISSLLVIVWCQSTGCTSQVSWCQSTGCTSQVSWCQSTGSTSQVSWAPFPATASLFTFLYFTS